MSYKKEHKYLHLFYREDTDMPNPYFRDAQLILRAAKADHSKRKFSTKITRAVDTLFPIPEKETFKCSEHYMAQLKQDALIDLATTLDEYYVDIEKDLDRKPVELKPIVGGWHFNDENSDIIFNPKYLDFGPYWKPGLKKELPVLIFTEDHEKYPLIVDRLNKFSKTDFYQKYFWRFMKKPKKGKNVWSVEIRPSNNESGTPYKAEIIEAIVYDQWCESISLSYPDEQEIMEENIATARFFGISSNKKDAEEYIKFLKEVGVAK